MFRKLLLVPMLLATTTVATPAVAQIETPATGNGELVLTVWDQTAGESYTRDLGYLLSDFGPGAFTDPDFSLLWAPDPLLTDFLAAAQGNLVVWNVLAGDSTGAAGQRSVLTTAPTALTEAQLQAGTTGAFNQSLANLQTYQQAQNALDGHALTDPGAALADSGNAYAGSAGFGSNLGGALANYSNTTALGEAANFWMLRPAVPAPGLAPGERLLAFFGLLRGFLSGTGPVPFAGVDATPFGLVVDDAFFNSTFRLLQDGTLVFAVPVPEASRLGLMASGLLALAWLARRRQGRAQA